MICLEKSLLLEKVDEAKAQKGAVSSVWHHEQHGAAGAEECGRRAGEGSDHGGCVLSCGLLGSHRGWIWGYRMEAGRLVWHNCNLLLYPFTQKGFPVMKLLFLFA